MNITVHTWNFVSKFRIYIFLIAKKDVFRIYLYHAYKKCKYKDCLKIANAQDDAVSLLRGSDYDHNLHQFDTSSILQPLVIGIHSMAQLMGIHPK